MNVSVEGAVRLLSSANPVSDDQGRIAVQVSCPITMPNRSTITVRLSGASPGEIRKQALLYVRLEVQRIERFRLMVDQPGQALLSVGRGQAFEPMYFRVLAEGSRGTPAVDSRLNLQLLTSQDNNDLLFLTNDRCDVQPERSVHNPPHRLSILLTCRRTIDPNSGAHARRDRSPSAVCGAPRRHGQAGAASAGATNHLQGGPRVLI